eukprot:s348_g30.t1
MLPFEHPGTLAPSSSSWGSRSKILRGHACAPRPVATAVNTLVAEEKEQLKGGKSMYSVGKPPPVKAETREVREGAKRERPGKDYEPFFPATVVESQKYSPHFLVSCRSRCLRGKDAAPLLELLPRQAEASRKGGKAEAKRREKASTRAPVPFEPQETRPKAESDASLRAPEPAEQFVASLELEEPREAAEPEGRRAKTRNPEPAESLNHVILNYVDGTALANEDYDLSKFLTVVDEVVDMLKAGHGVLSCCRNGAHRNGAHRSATETAVMVMRMSGWSSAKAEAYVSTLRNCVDLNSTAPPSSHRRYQTRFRLFVFRAFDGARQCQRAVKQETLKPEVKAEEKAAEDVLGGTTLSSEGGSLTSSSVASGRDLQNLNVSMLKLLQPTESPRSEAKAMPKPPSATSNPSNMETDEEKKVMETDGGGDGGDGDFQPDYDPDDAEPEEPAPAPLKHDESEQSAEVMHRVLRRLLAALA